jgi:hypothetical protein
MIRIAAPIERVAALAGTGDGFTKWWAEDVSTAADGVVTLGFFNRETLYVLRPLESSAHCISWRCESGHEWSGTEIRFELTPDKAVTVLRFTHAGWRAATDFFTSCNTTWGELVFRLAGDAEGHPRGPLFKRNGLAY